MPFCIGSFVWTARVHWLQSHPTSAGSNPRELLAENLYFPRDARGAQVARLPNLGCTRFHMVVKSGMYQTACPMSTRVAMESFPHIVKGVGPAALLV